MGHSGLLNAGVANSINKLLRSVSLCQGCDVVHAGLLAEPKEMGAMFHLHSFLLFGA